ncbi:MAG: divergent PAP2 family protein, partial [Salinispira sp.]
LTGNVGSPWFSISAVFAIIVIHDALKLRRNVEEQSRVINRLITELPDSRRHKFQKLSEQHGHSGVEVVLGIIFGTFHAVIFRFFTSLL